MADRRTRMPTGTPAWIRLGRLLEARRAELDPAYSGNGGRSAFARERGISLKMAQDIENNDRENFTGVTLRDIIAPAYGVTPESITAALDGGDLEPQAFPPPLTVVPPVNLELGPDDILPELSPELRRQAAAHIPAIRDLVLKAVLTGPLTGDRIFGAGSQEAIRWDILADIGQGDPSGPYSPALLIWMTAVARALEAESGTGNQRARGLIPV